MRGFATLYSHWGVMRKSTSPSSITTRVANDPAGQRFTAATRCTECRMAAACRCGC